MTDTTETAADVQPVPDIALLWRDDYIAVVAKPPKLLVHRTEIANGDTVFAVQCVRDMLGQKVWPVHRLDRGTSGCLVFALSAEVASTLGKQFMTSDAVQKRYLACVRGWLPAPVLAAHPLVPPVDPYLKKKLGCEAQSAETVFTPVAQAEVPVACGAFPCTRLGLVRAELLTGRRHQIRRHLKWLAHPIIGDATYGKGALNRAMADYFGGDRLMLHCARMRFAHPVTGEMLDIRAPLDPLMTALFDRLGWRAAAEDAVAAPWAGVPDGIERLA